MLFRYKPWLFTLLGIFSAILIMLKISDIYHTRLSSMATQRAADTEQFSPSDTPELIVVNPQEYNQQIRKIEQQKAELEILKSAIDKKIEDLKKAESEVLELLESTDINE